MNRSKFHFWLFLAAFFAAWIFRATWFYSRMDLSITNPTGRLVFSNLVKFSLWVLPAAAYLAWHERRQPLQAMKASTKVDKGGAAISLWISAAFLGGILVVEYFSSGQTLAPLLNVRPVSIVSALSGISASAVIEELFFRGFVLQKLDEDMRFWVANLIQALLFVGIHWPNWLWVGGFHWSLLTTSASILLLGLVLGWLVRRTNSVWAGVLLHIANNFLAAFLA